MKKKKLLCTKQKIFLVFTTDCEQAFCWPRRLKPTLLLIRPKQAEGIMGVSSTTKLPSHLDDSQPQSTFSIGTEPGEQGLASRIDLSCPPTPVITVHLSLQYDLSDLQMHQTHPHASEARWQCVQGVKGGRRNSDIPTLLRELLLSESDGIVDRTL